MRNSMQNIFAWREMSGGARHWEKFAELTVERLHGNLPVLFAGSLRCRMGIIHSALPVQTSLRRREEVWVRANFQDKPPHGLSHGEVCLGKRGLVLLGLSLPFFLVPVLLGKGENVAIDAGELGLRCFEIFCCDFAFVQKTTQVFGFLFQPGKFPVDATQCPGGGGVRIVIHSITSQNISL